MEARYHPGGVTDRQVACGALPRHFPVMTYGVLTDAGTFDDSDRVLIPAVPSTSVREGSATVVWATNNHAAKECFSELDCAIAETYRFRTGTDAFDAISPGDQFGPLVPVLTKYFA